MRITHHREMGITHAELFRLLPRLLNGHEWRYDEGGIRVDDSPRRLYIGYEAETERRIAALRLPVTHIHFEFDGYSEAQASAFMAHFDQTFRRGGG